VKRTPKLANNVDIRLRRSAIPGKVPTVDQLNLGELAINTHDGKLFLKKEYDGGIEQIVEVGAFSGAGLSSTFNNYIYTSDGTLQTVSGIDDAGNSLTYDLSTPSRLQVYLNGVLLHQGIDYTANDGENISLTYPVDSDQVVQVATYNSEGASFDNDFILDDGFAYTVGTNEETKFYHNSVDTIIKHYGYNDGQFKIMYRDSDRLTVDDTGIYITGNFRLNGEEIVSLQDVLDAIQGGSGIDYDPTNGTISVDNTIATKNYAETYAEMYADSQDAVTLQSAQSYADSNDALTLGSANAYADTQDAIILTTANQHAELYADSAVLGGIVTANAYTDSSIATVTVDLQNYADSAVNIAITNLIDGAPEVLDTLNEIAEAIGDDSDFIGTVQNWINQKLDATATTDDVAEGTQNLYFTETRVRQSLSVSNGLTFDPVTGEFGIDSSDDVTFNSVTATSFIGDLQGNADTATDADQLDGQHGTYYRINVYDVNGTLVN